MIAEKCTKTSSPVCRWMKPYPFEALNHFTVPCSFDTAADLELKLLCFSWSGPGLPSAGTSSARKKKAAKFVLAAPLNESKGNTRATNADSKNTTKTLVCPRRTGAHRQHVVPCKCLILSQLRGECRAGSGSQMPTREIPAAG